MTGQQTTTKYRNNSVDRSRPSRTTGKFIKHPPLKVENIKYRAPLYPLSTAESYEKLQGSITVRERLEKPLSKNNEMYANQIKSSSLKNLKLIVDETVAYDGAQNMKHKNQAFPKEICRTVSSQPANDRLTSFRRALASNDKIQAPTRELNNYKNIFGSMQAIDKNEDFGNTLSTKSRSSEYLNLSPVNKLEGKSQGKNQSWSLCTKIWPINVQLKQSIKNSKFVCSYQQDSFILTNIYSGLLCSAKEYSNASHLNCSSDARRTWVISNNFCSLDQLSTTSQTYTQPKLEFISALDEKLCKTADQVFPFDTMSTERTLSNADSCFQKALQDSQKYQRIEEQKKKFSKPSIRPQRFNSYKNTNGSNFDE